jgi:hypothetical protein
MTDAQHAKMAEAFFADTKSVSGSRLILNTKIPQVKKIGTIVNAAKACWKAYTNAFEDGVRLIRTDKIEMITKLIDLKQAELEEAKQELYECWGEVQNEAAGRLQELYCESDYNFDPRALIHIGLSFPAIEPDKRLLDIAPELFAREKEKIASQFQQAAIAAQQSLESEFANMLSSLVEKLRGEEHEDGKKRVLKQAAVDNVIEFANRFRACSVNSSEDLEKLVAQAEQLATGVSAKGLDAGAKVSIAEKFAEVRASLEKCIVTKKGREFE